MNKMKLNAPEWIKDTNAYNEVQAHPVLTSSWDKMIQIAFTSEITFQKRVRQIVMWHQEGYNKVYSQNPLPPGSIDPLAGAAWDILEEMTNREVERITKEKLPKEQKREKIAKLMTMLDKEITEYGGLIWRERVYNRIHKNLKKKINHMEVK
ncbi:MAG: hypothetical protein AB1414_00255 [bacterium]